MALQADLDWVSSLAISLVQRLQIRNLPGDEELAQDLLAGVQGEPPPGQLLPVDLERLSGLIEGDPASNEGGFLDLQTGSARVQRVPSATSSTVSDMTGRRSSCRDMQ